MTCVIFDQGFKTDAFLFPLYYVLLGVVCMSRANSLNEVLITAPTDTQKWYFKAELA